MSEIINTFCICKKLIEDILLKTVVKLLLVHRYSK